MELVVNRAVDDARLKAAVAISKSNRRAGLCHVECENIVALCNVVADAQCWEMRGLS
jgi:hypothetical protein